MEKFIITGGKKLHGTASVSGAKNVALKALVAACLTDEEVIIENIPLISDFFVMVDIINDLGGEVSIDNHTAKVSVKKFKKSEISLEQGSHIRTSAMFLSPLLARNKHAKVPNPGGCRLGARPIDRTIEGLVQMGAEISYSSDDGFFHAKTEGLKGVSYTFDKSTHTGTETLLLAAACAKGTTLLNNAAAEPEIDELIELLNQMGAKIKRIAPRTIEITGVSKLHGTTFRIGPDRNEVVTLAIAAIMTKGEVFVKDAGSQTLDVFIAMLEEAGAGVEIKKEGIRFFYKGSLLPTKVETSPYPGFMTDWQAPWTVLMTQADGVSQVIERVFENKFGYVSDLEKMGGRIEPFQPSVDDPKEYYNFNLEDDENYVHAVNVYGPTPLHNAVVNMTDIRAGAAIVLAALGAKGQSVIHNIGLVDRGYEQFEKRLAALGADIARVKE